MGILVIAKFLLLGSNVDGDLHCLTDVADGAVQLECPLRLLRDVVILAHQVVHQLVGKRVKLDLGDHLDHLRDHSLAIGDVELKSLAIELGLVVVTGSVAPLRLAFVELSDLEVFFGIVSRMLQYNFGVFIHLLVRLGDDEGVVTFASENQEFNCFFLGAFSLTVSGNHQGALRQLTFLTENLFGTLWVVKMLQV